MLEIIHIDLLLEYHHNSIFPELYIEHIALEVEFSKRSVLDIVPENEPVAWVGGVVTSAYESNDVGSEEHLAKLYSSFEIYRVLLISLLTSKECGLKLIGVEYP